MNESFCPACSGYLNYVQQYERWYCQRCAAYTNPASQQPQKYQKQMVSQQPESMVYVKGQQPYQQQQIQPGQGKFCKQCGTVNENWSVTCKSCRSGIC